MTRRWISMILVIVFVLGTCTSCSLARYQETVTVMDVEGVEVIYKESASKREATAIVEGIPVLCEYYPNTDECNLFIDDEPIPVHIVEHEDRIEVFLEEEYLSRRFDFCRVAMEYERPAVVQRDSRIIDTLLTDSNDNDAD